MKKKKRKRKISDYQVLNSAKPVFIFYIFYLSYRRIRTSLVNNAQFFFLHNVTG